MCLGGLGTLKQGEPATVAPGLDLIMTGARIMLYCGYSGPCRLVPRWGVQEATGNPAKDARGVGSPSLEPLLKQVLSRIWLAWASEGQVQRLQRLCKSGCPLVAPACALPGSSGKAQRAHSLRTRIAMADRGGAEGKEGGGGQAPAIKGRGWWPATLPRGQAKDMKGSLSSGDRAPQFPPASPSLVPNWGRLLM